jgi:hemerythrin-like metal-binding protein
VGLSSQVAKVLEEIVAKVRQVDELVAEVANASSEQSRGIQQLNSAMAQMDKVTQSNAAGAEESASSAQELSAQAEAVKAAVAELLDLVGGQADGVAPTIHAPEPPREKFIHRAPANASTRLRRPASATPPAHSLTGEEDVLIQWDPEKMSTGVDTIDEQHMELINMINQLHRACLAGAGRQELRQMMNFLAEYVHTHFKHEEGIMEQHQCPSKAKNKMAHQKFLSDFGKLVASFEARGETTAVLLDLRRLVADWLVNHICSVDTKLRGCAGNCDREHQASSRVE